MSDKTIATKKYILFDLDGTLTDSADGIVNSVIYALKKFGVKSYDRASLYKFVGPPLVDSFVDYIGFDREKAERAVSVYREYYRENGIFENRVYDGIEDLLKSLKDAGKTLVVATSKPAVFSERILRRFGLWDYFTFLSGAELDGRRTVKSEVIAYALESVGIPKDDVVMVGDRHHDIDGAHANGIPAIGVLYGYGSKDEHIKAGAEMIAETVDDLKTKLLTDR